MRCALENLYRAQKAVVAILFEQKLPIRGLEVLTDDGTVTLRGTAQDHPSIERAGKRRRACCSPGR